MTIFKEHDIVVSKFELNDVPKNTNGTIVHIYSDFAYVVEFLVNNKSIVKTVFKDQIK